MKFIHLTDPHLVTSGDTLHGIDPLQRLRECLSHIAEKHDDAVFCVITGDLADQGQQEAYQALHDELAVFPLKTHLLLGNHDHRQNFLAAFPNKSRDAHQFIQSTLSHECGDFVFLDTLDQGQHAGLYCEARRNWLSGALARAKNRDVFLFMHHPPFQIGMPQIDSMSLANPQEFTEIIESSNRIRHLFFGHLHRPVSGAWRGIPFSTLFGTNHQVALDFDTIDVIPYSLEPPAYSVVLIEHDRTIVHTCYYQDETAWRPERRPSAPS